MFSRVSAEHASEIAHQALMRGLEHEALNSESTDKVTFFFTTQNAKNAFDEMVDDLGYAVDGNLPVSYMIDVVSEGASASSVLDLLQEKVSKGMKNALSRGKVKHSCASCNMSVPVYSGRYPSKCPECSEPFTKEGE